ncbi:hypothetical protein VNI00_018215 [Paramarasmius palmivorus]|uniref:F-box domain-containing protein n=1 Tax=Paramarasmius palmivorus TaxID=297713 RepID=A0AAW0AYU3_9AGAR
MYRVATQLPREVLDTILESMDPLNGRQSLRQCALAARSLLPAAQRILFRHVSLNEVSWTRQGRIDQFHRLLEGSPHLAKYTVELGICYLSPSAKWGDDLSQKPLASIIPRLQSLKKIDLCLVLEFGTMPAVTSSQVVALLGGMAMPNISSFSIIGLHAVDINEIFGICEWFAARGGLQNLQLKDISTTVSTIPSQTPSSCVKTVTPIHLRQFTITRDSKVIDKFLRWATSSTSPLRFTELHELTVSHLTEQSCVYILRVLDLAKSSLTCLCFMGDTASLSAFQFNAFRHLRCIFFDLRLPYIERSRPMLNEWCTALERSSGLKLESFIIQMNTSFRDGLHLGDPLAELADYPWNKLEDALVNGTQCARVVLQIRISFERMKADILQGYFPLLHSNTVSELVVRQIVYVANSRVFRNWEYRSFSREWKEVVVGSFFE